MTARDDVMVEAMLAMERFTAEVRASSLLSWGEQQRFRSYIPRKTVDELLDDESPYVHGYAMALQEFLAAFDAAPKAPFVPKGKPAR